MSADYYCEECHRYFKTQKTLERHQRWERYQIQDTPKREVNATVAKERQHCPVCGTLCLIYPNEAAARLTCCNTCFALYQIGDGRQEREPPELCAAEAAGMRCPQPSHKYWARKYKEKQGALIV